MNLEEKKIIAAALVKQAENFLSIESAMVSSGFSAFIPAQECNRALLERILNWVERFDVPRFDFNEYRRELAKEAMGNWMQSGGPGSKLGYKSPLLSAIRKIEEENDINFSFYFSDDRVLSEVFDRARNAAKEQFRSEAMLFGEDINSMSFHDANNQKSAVFLAASGFDGVRLPKRKSIPTARPVCGFEVSPGWSLVMVHSKPQFNANLSEVDIDWRFYLIKKDIDDALVTTIAKLSEIYWLGCQSLFLGFFAYSTASSIPEIVHSTRAHIRSAELWLPSLRSAIQSFP
jgi:hypothetical protein